MLSYRIRRVSQSVESCSVLKRVNNVVHIDLEERRTENWTLGTHPRYNTKKRRYLWELRVFTRQIRNKSLEQWTLNVKRQRRKFVYLTIVSDPVKCFWHMAENCFYSWFRYRYAFVVELPLIESGDSTWVDCLFYENIMIFMSAAFNY